MAIAAVHLANEAPPVCKLDLDERTDRGGAFAPSRMSGVHARRRRGFRGAGANGRKQKVQGEEAISALQLRSPVLDVNRVVPEVRVDHVRVTIPVNVRDGDAAGGSEQIGE